MLASIPRSTLCLVGLALLALCASPAVDLVALKAAQEAWLHHRDFVTFADDLTNYGNAWELLPAFFAVLLVIGLCTGRWPWRLALTTSIVVLATGLLVNILKVSVGRGRPRLWMDSGITGFEPLAFESAWGSWPSGHAVTAAAFAVCIAAQHRRLWPLCLTFALVIAATRPIVRAHWVSDAIAGLLIGTLAARLLLAHPQFVRLQSTGYDALARLVRRRAQRLGAFSRALSRLGRGFWPKVPERTVIPSGTPRDPSTAAPTA